MASAVSIAEAIPPILSVLARVICPIPLHFPKSIGGFSTGTPHGKTRTLATSLQIRFLRWRAPGPSAMPTRMSASCEKGGSDWMTHFFWDTNLFIYQWDNSSVFQPSVHALRKKMLEGGIGLVTSAMTLGEIMTGPRRDGQEAIALQYKAALTQAATIVP